ncbi:hypothetical protein H4582DRAFT_2057963 [Lactarius indigo]|nr:hypothetical protein H4582DRAFT_2057963 [Lactarius indigo]
MHNHIKWQCTHTDQGTEVLRRVKRSRTTRTMQRPRTAGRKQRNTVRFASVSQNRIIPRGCCQIDCLAAPGATMIIGLSPALVRCLLTGGEKKGPGQFFPTACLCGRYTLFSEEQISNMVSGESARMKVTKEGSGKASATEEWGSTSTAKKFLSGHTARIRHSIRGREKCGGSEATQGSRAGMDSCGHAGNAEDFRTERIGPGISRGDRRDLPISGELTRRSSSRRVV